MGKFLELKSEEVRKTCSLEILPFETTDELEPYTEIIGQERAVRSMEFGLQIQREGYNIFMTGPSGTGKVTYAQAMTHQIAKREPIPDDWCYVYNFEHPDQPMALSFPAGEGKVFVQRMSTLLEELIVEIPRTFESEEYERQKNEIFNYYQNAKNDLMDELNDYTKERGFLLQEKKTGIITVASVEGRPITQDEYDQLSEKEQEQIQVASEEIQNKAVEIFRLGRQIEREFIETLDKLDRETGSLVVDFLFKDLVEAYQADLDILHYLEGYKQDVVESLNEFRGKNEQEELLFLQTDDDEPHFTRYQVNLFIDNSESEGAPVIFETNPTYYRLMGKVEYVSQMGSLVTSFMQIKPGAIHRANGGYLILSIRDLLINGESWDAVKRVLKTGKILIENLGESYGLVSVASLRPVSIPLNAKVILVGNPYYYYLLLQLDEDFQKLFKIKADFDNTMEWNEENVQKIARFVRTYGEQIQLLPFHASAVAELISFSSRLAGEQDRLSTHFNLLTEIINEAEAWAKFNGDELVMQGHIKKAVLEKSYRNNRVEEIIQKRIHEGTLLIETSGRRIGQVNALVVMDFGDYTFGHPSKVTAVTYRGQRGVFHIERETKMSGSVHDKGLLILTSLFSSRYAQEKRLNITASLTFEQVYGGVDGDSASCAEFVALTSAIGRIPINQNIAITGSINQHGAVQPIGGVTEKVEGFFKTCVAEGLTGDQGVIIPHQNVKNLQLNDEVVEAIEKRKFHIYPIRNVDEAIEILIGLPVGHKRKDGSYPKNTVNYLVEEHLQKFSEDQKDEES